VRSSQLETAQLYVPLANKSSVEGSPVCWPESAHWPEVCKCANEL